MIFRPSRDRSHRTSARAWTDLHPNGKVFAMVSMSRHRSAVAAIGRTGLLMIVAHSGTLARMGRPQIRHKGDGKRRAVWHAAHVLVTDWERRTP
jgi:hypothetical protein